MQALVDTPLEPTASFYLLDAVLADPDPGLLRNWSTSGKLAHILPEWRRLTGDWNIQHNAHHFPLDEHTFNVVEGTKASPYFARLTPYQQSLTRWAALLHDIDKNTGPERLRPVISVDKLHPIKSAVTGLAILQRFGCSPETRQRIFTLIHHHQLVGRLFILYPQGNVPEQVLMNIALKVRSVPLLDCLVALSEGDIRGVQHEHAYFTPLVSEQLADYTARLQARLRQIRQALPPPDWYEVPETGTSRLYQCAPGLMDLVERVTRMPWGGPVLCQASSPAGVPSAPYGITMRFLPENIAYVGPSFPALEAITTMPGFYGLLTDEATAGAEFSATEREALAQAAQWKATLQPYLSEFAASMRYTDWSEAAAWLEDETFTEPLPDAVGPLMQAFTAYRQRTPALAGPWAVMGTRPIITGVWLPAHEAEAWRATFPEIPVVAAP